MPDFAWILKMALRDFRKNLSRLLLFVSSIVVGIAALVAISSFGENLVKEFNNYAWSVKGLKPMDNFNHLIDASRYGIQYVLTRSVPKGMYIVR